MATQKDVYQLYNDIVKPLYCEIEAQGNDIPVELLFETYAAFDHLKRIYIEGEPEVDCCKKAKSHLKRGALDAFKLKLKYFNTEVEGFMRSRSALALIDNGEFLTNLTVDRVRINDMAKQARISEGRNKNADSFDPWFEVSLGIDEFRSKYFERHLSLQWASRMTFGFINKERLVSFVLGVVASIAAYFLTKGW